MKKLAVLLSILSLLLFISMPLSAAAADAGVRVRIEGITATLFNGDVPLGDAQTVADLLRALDAQRDDLAFTGLDAGYITAVNGDTAAAFGGWDGWLFTVNGAEAAAGIDATAIAAGDSLLLYYGDPYGVGMQFPELTLADGVLTLTSRDTVYDADFNPTVTVNPIAAATVTWYVGDTAYTYTSDEAGKVTLPAAVLTPGNHRVTVSKTAANGLPLVLRADSVHSIAAPANTASPQTGAASAAWIWLLPAAALAVLALSARRGRSHAA